MATGSRSRLSEPEELTLSDPIPTFVISLPQAKERQQRVAHEFAKIGLDYAIWPGVDGRANFDALLAQTDAAAWARNMGAPLSAGHLGCYAAHVGLWQHVAQIDAPAVLICEDDVTFRPDFPQALAAGVSAVAEWDVLRLACLRAKRPVAIRPVGRYRLTAFWGPFTGNACYLIRPTVAARLAARFYPICRAHDHEMNRFFDHEYRLFGLMPFAAAPDDGQESFITGTAMSEAVKFPKWRRLPHYGQKLANYARRRAWLAREGYLRG